jgi:hypothetical protein
MSLIVHYIANRAASYFFSKFELYVCSLLFAENAPHHYSENIYNFQQNNIYLELKKYFVKN